MSLPLSNPLLPSHPLLRTPDNSVLYQKVAKEALTLYSTNKWKLPETPGARLTGKEGKPDILDANYQGWLLRQREADHFSALGKRLSGGPEQVYEVTHAHTHTHSRSCTHTRAHAHTRTHRPRL